MEYQNGETAELIEHANGENPEQAELVQTQNDGTQDGQAEIVPPQEDTKSVSDMTDEEFADYIASAKNGEVQAEKKVAADSQTAPTQQGPEVPVPVPEKKSEEPTKPFMQFDTKEALQEYQDATIGKRIAEVRQKYEPYKATADKLEEIARRFYGTEDGPAAVENLIADLTRQNADKTGQTVDEYNRVLEMERDAKAYRAQQQALKERDDVVSRIQNEWKRQEEKLRQIVPDFSMETAFGNPAFYQKVVQEGYSLAEAYMLTAKKPNPPREMRRAIQEVGAQKNTVSGNIKQDVGAMTDKEFDAYIRRITEG